MLVKIKPSYISFLLGVIIYNLKAQNYISTTNLIGVESGLSSKEVYCAIKDKNGFMWFGTRNGLNRYDGKNFITFTKETNGLQGNSVKQIVLGPNNTLIILYSAEGTYWLPSKKTDVMDLKTFKIQSFNTYFKNCPFKETSIIWLENNVSNAVKFILNEPYEVWQLIDNTFTKCFDIESISGFDVNYMHSIHRSYLYSDICLLGRISLTSNNYYYKNKAIKIHNSIGIKSDCYPFKYIYPNTIVLLKTEPSTIFTLLKLPNNELTISNTLGYPNDIVDFFHVKQDSNSIYKLKNEDWYYSLGKSAIKIINHEEINQWKIGPIFQVYKDDLGIIWICTTAGIIKVKISEQLFNTQFIAENNKINNQARGIIKNQKNELFANVNDQLYVLQNNGNSFKINMKDYQYGFLEHNSEIYSCGFDLQKINQINYRIEQQPNTRLRGFIQCAISLNDSQVILGYKEGLKIYNTKTKQLQKHLNTFFSVYFFKKKKNGTIWACGESGLLLLDKNGNELKQYSASEKTAEPFPSKNFTDILDLDNGDIWLTSNGGGLVYWNQKNNTFKQYTRKKGMPSDIMYGLLMDKKNELWISTENGLVNFNPRTEEILVFYQRNGLPNNEFNRMSRYMDETGNMYFGTVNGITIFNPNNINFKHENYLVPFSILAINQFKKTEKKLIDVTELFNINNSIELQPGDNFFTVDFQLLDFENWQNVYSYKIEGIDKDWIYTKENSLRLSNLPYGKFKLIIRAKTIHGLWNKNTIEIPIVVLKPFYFKWWFIALCVMLILILTYSIIRIRINTLKKQKSSLENMIKQRTESLNKTLGEKETLLEELHHRVKNNLQVIIGLFELQSGNTTNEEAKKALLDGQNRMQSILLLHKNLYENEMYDQVDLGVFIGNLVQHLYEALNTPGIKVQINLEIATIFISIHRAISVGIMLNELITNSFKYGYIAKNTNYELNINISEKEEKIVASYSEISNDKMDFWNKEYPNNLGIMLIKDMLRQIGAEYNVSFAAGFNLQFTFEKI